MSDEQDDNHGMVGWIIGIAVTIAIAVSILTGILAANESSGKKSDTASTTTTAAAAAPTGLPATFKVHFQSNSFATPEDTNKDLAGLIAYSKSSASAKLSISGFHDKTGDPAKNEDLAKNRAKIVKDLLLAAGVPEDRIIMQKPVETTGGIDDKEARRVEVSAVQ